MFSKVKILLFLILIQSLGLQSLLESALLSGSKKSCPYGFVGTNCNIECGVTFNEQNQKIVGGSVAVANSWPSQILLHGCQFGICYDMCGGSLIDPKTVLTAAHCIDYENMQFNVYLGVHNINKKDDEGVKIKVSKVIKHKLYNVNGDSLNDIAILKLEKSAPINKKIQVACLPKSQSTKFPSANIDTWAVGWGKTNEDGDSMNSLLKNVKITVYNSTMCSKVYPEVNKNWNTQICAGEYAGGKDTCQGDSGGPLFVLGKINRKNKYILSGLTSYGDGCARRALPGIYTKVSAFMDFIKPNME